MGTESLKSEVITESISQAQPYGEVIAAYEESYGIFVSLFPALVVPRRCAVHGDSRAHDSHAIHSSWVDVWPPQQ